MKPTVQGFTLIELMVVIAIISVLAAVAVPNYQDYISRSQLVEALSLVSGLKARVKECHDFDEAFPADNAAAGLPPADKLLGNYVTGIELVNGAFHIHLGNRIARPLQGKVLSLRPIVVTGSPASPFSWICGNARPPQGMEAVGENRTDLPATYLPYNCR
jgi:type IV pilus assembly protein PilA